MNGQSDGSESKQQLSCVPPLHVAVLHVFASQQPQDLAHFAATDGTEHDVLFKKKAHRDGSVSLHKLFSGGNSL